MSALDYGDVIHMNVSSQCLNTQDTVYNRAPNSLNKTEQLSQDSLMLLFDITSHYTKHIPDYRSVLRNLSVLDSEKVGRFLKTVSLTLLFDQITHIWVIQFHDQFFFLFNSLNLP